MKYGNKETIFNFSKGTNLITGSNGAGKSSIFMALHYVLFGKTYNGKTISSLVNNTNKKGMLVVLEFEVNDIQYKDPYNYIKQVNKKDNTIKLRKQIINIIILSYLLCTSIESVNEYNILNTCIDNFYMHLIEKGIKYTYIKNYNDYDVSSLIEKFITEFFDYNNIN